MREVNNGEDILDSRDVDSRIEELESERDAAAESGEDFADCEELAALVAFRDEASGYCADWQYGGVLIRDSHFTDYARELAEDCGDLKHADRVAVIMPMRK